MLDFTYEALPQRVVFGSGTQARIAEELDRLGSRRAVILTTPQQKDSGERLAETIGGRCAGIFSEAAMHTPVEVTDRAVALVAEKGADLVIAVGGGSTTGLGKAIALRTDLPQIVIPTTYAGSEATPILGQTEGGRKTTIRDMKVLPEVVVYDVDLTLTLPVGMTVTSGLNAIAHAVEALYTKDRNPIISNLALQGIEALAQALPAIVAQPSDRDARARALYGAWACGICLGSVGMALHHKVCHTLGGSFDLPHAETHSVVLPHAIAYNERAVAEELRPVAKLLGGESAAQGLWDLAKFLGAPMTLAELGLAAGYLPRAAEIMMQNPYWNPQPLVEADLKAMLEDAFAGHRPGTSLEAVR